MIPAAFVASQGIYAGRALFLDLREAGETCRKRRIARLMRENRLRPPLLPQAALGDRQTRHPDPEAAATTVHGDSAQQSLGHGHHLHSDMASWLYLAVVMDLCAQIVGLSAEPTIHSELLLDAVMSAVRGRRPHGALFHSDQGHAVRG